MADRKTGRTLLVAIAIVLAIAFALLIWTRHSRHGNPASPPIRGQETRLWTPLGLARHGSAIA